MAIEPVDVVRRLFAAVERRDLPAVLECYDPGVEIHEAAALPYGGVYRGHDGALQHARAWYRAWGGLQTGADTRMAASLLPGPDGTVVALFDHRAADRHCGIRLEEPEVSVYQVSAGKVTRSQMFHADSATVAGFLEHVRRTHPDLRPADLPGRGDNA
jgi:ketosteroid isomerase-like protein